MEKTIITFDDIEIEKQKSHRNKRPFSLKNMELIKL